MIMTAFASKHDRSSVKRIANSFQEKEQVDYGAFIVICYDYEDIPCDCFLRMQGPGWYIRTFHGDWGILWTDDRHLGPSSS